jgi:beta-N-acetylglucosaminidase
VKRKTRKTAFFAAFLFLFALAATVFTSRLIVQASAPKCTDKNTFVQTTSAGYFAFNWGNGGPIKGITDQFCANLTQTVPSSGDYFVYTYADDGVTVEVNGKKLIDRWKNSAGVFNKAIAEGLTAGSKVLTKYYDDHGKAALFSAAQPLGHWLAYYYDNENLSGNPVNSRVISQSDGSLVEDHGYDAPISKVPKDHFSARYVTAKRLAAGDYIIRTRADDGIRVLVDGKKVIDRWSTSNYAEDETKVTVSDSNGSNIHWIEVQYFDRAGKSRIDVTIQPFNQAITSDSWLGVFYSNQNLTGLTKAVGGKYAQTKLTSVHNNWGYSSPLSGIPKDGFSASFYKKIAGGSDYFVETYADDGVKVSVDNKAVINRWSNSAGRYDHAYLTGLSSGDHTIRTDYYDAHGKAVIFADAVKFGSWLAYYYDNENLSGNPVNGRVISQSDGSLIEDHGYDTPISKVPKDHFSARYVTAKRLAAGDYIIRTRADDGIRVLVDGKKVIDRWSTSDYAEDETKVTVSDNNGSNIHWIEVQYFDRTGKSRIDVTIQPFNQAITSDSWLGVFYSNQNLTGSTKAIGGKYAQTKLTSVHYNWGDASPLSGMPKDGFSASFYKKIADGSDYFVETYADDGVKVSVDNKALINRWSNSAGRYDHAYLTGLSSGDHTIRTDYYDDHGKAVIFADAVKFGSWLAYYYDNENLSGNPVNSRVISRSDGSLVEDHGDGAPISKVPKDHFSARYVTAKRLSAGDYLIRTRADDGIRVLVDGKKVIDRWSTSNYAEDAVKVTLSDSNGSNIHWIEVQYFERTGKSRINVSIQPFNRSSLISASKWYGEIYPQQDLKGNPVLLLGGSGSSIDFDDPNLDFDWEYKSPGSLIPVDHFSAVFERKINLDEKYNLSVVADDGVRVYVDNVKKIDMWQNGYNEKTVQIDKGSHTIRVEYYENTGKAYLQLYLTRVYTDNPYLHIDLRKPADITATDIVNFFNKKGHSDSILKNYAQAFIDAQNKFGVNAQYLVAHAIWETGWGGSNLAKYKNNFYGYGAYNVCPFTCAYYFPSGSEGINYAAYKIRTDYLESGGAYYDKTNGPTLIGMSQHYATDPNWRNGIASLMASIKPYDPVYYTKQSPLGRKSGQPGSYGRDIPDGKPYPKDVIINYSPPKDATVVSGGYGFRTIPYVSSSTLIKTLPGGTAVKVLGYNTDVLRNSNYPYKNYWYRVSVNGQKGWIYGDGLKIK